jgi:hypothetical protein
VYGSGALVARENGQTAGVTHQGGQTVFTSSVAPRKHAAHRAHAITRSAQAHAAVPSQRTATGDVWSGFAAPAKSSPVAAAAAYSAGHGSGLSSQLVIGLVILGVGLTGLFGGAVAVSVSRRRTAANTRVDGQR